MAENDAPSRFRRLTSPVRRLSGRLAGGISIGFLVALAALVLIAILFTVATRKAAEPRGYAEMTLYPKACLVDTTRQSGSVGCLFVGPRTYRVGFGRSLAGSTPIASRGSCCSGGIGVSTVTDHTVVLVVPSRVRRPIRASVFIP
jgi:hypothetical protein